LKLKRAHLYLRQYPRLIRQINRLVELVQREDPNVALLALFGSTARLEPRAISDADVLVLLHDSRSLHEVGKTAKILRLLGIAEDAPQQEWCDWSFSMIDGNAQASDLDEDFVSIVGQDGVLLYQQAGASLPPALAALTPYAVWLERVQTLLAGAERMVAAQAAKVAS